MGRENCGGCDICSTPREEFDATEIAQKILSAVIRTGERFGARHVTDVLRGATTKQVKNREHDQLTVFGIAADHSAQALDELIDGMVAKDLIARDSGKFPILTATRNGRDFLKSRAPLTLTRQETSSEIDSDRFAEDSPEYVATDMPENPDLFQELRALRKTLADEAWGAGLRDIRRRTVAANGGASPPEPGKLLEDLRGWKRQSWRSSASHFRR